MRYGSCQSATETTVSNRYLFEGETAVLPPLLLLRPNNYINDGMLHLQMDKPAKIHKPFFGMHPLVKYTGPPNTDYRILITEYRIPITEY